MAIILIKLINNPQLQIINMTTTSIPSDSSKSPLVYSGGGAWVTGKNLLAVEVIFVQHF